MLVPSATTSLSGVSIRAKFGFESETLYETGASSPLWVVKSTESELALFRVSAYWVRTVTPPPWANTTAVSAPTPASVANAIANRLIKGLPDSSRTDKSTKYNVNRCRTTQKPTQKPVGFGSL